MVGACETRTKFLGRLGIHPNHRSNTTLPTRRIHPQTVILENKKPRSRKYPPSEEYSCKRVAPPGTSKKLDFPPAIITDSSATPDKPKVKFVGFVRVRWIPNRCDYSPSTKSALWSSRDEILENASRNTVEYAYEGWDITKVLEDDRMVDYYGQMIHPVHFCEVEDRKAYICHVMQKRRQNQRQTNRASS